MLTQDQIAKLHKSVDLAKNPGGCRYFDHFRQPECVIGQLLYLEAGPYVFNGSFNSNGFTVGALKPQEIKDYPLELLTGLQGMWDTSPSGEQIELKEKMHNLIDNYKG
jgi:hypothetical protein